MKHPKDRAERLRLKKIKFEEREKEISENKVRRLKEQLKEKETFDELARARLDNLELGTI